MIAEAAIAEPARSRPDPAPAAAPPLAARASHAAPADRWAALVAELAAAGRIAAFVRELAMQAECVAVDDAADPPLWMLRVEREALRAPAHADKLQAAIGEHLGSPVRLRVEAGAAAGSPARRAAAERESRQRAAERLIEDDPRVQQLMRQFKTARIVPGSIQPC